MSSINYSESSSLLGYGPKGGSKVSILFSGCICFLLLVIIVLLALVFALCTVIYIDFDRGDDDDCIIVPQNAFCGYSCGQVCIGKPKAVCFDPCYKSCDDGANNNSSAVLSDYFRRDFIHHVGLTVSNLTQSVDFYVNILGGVEVIGAGGDSWRGDDVFNLLFQKELLDSYATNKSLSDEKIANLATNGTDVLAARYINFGALQVELLDYRAYEGTTGSSLPFYHNTSSPSVVNNMHICLYLKDSVDMDSFVLTLESEAKKRGYDKVKCNRIVHVDNEQEREQVGEQLIYNSYLVTNGPFTGWRLVYCKGPDGEQFELAQALSKAKEAFQEATTAYVTSKN